MGVDLKDKIIVSNKGRQKIAFEGYFYNYKEITMGKIIWRCNKRGCTSLLKTNVAYLLLEITEHNHLQDDLKFNRVLFAAAAKKRALDTSETARDIVYNISKEINYSAYIKPREIRDLVNKTRKINDFTIDKHYDIPFELQNTSRGRKFLQFDSGMFDENRIVIFSTEENIDHFHHSKTIVIDGTFKSSPSNFEQLFTVQCVIRGKFLPLIYCFMTKKNEISYKKFFDWMSENYMVKNDKINDKSILLDFELASYNQAKLYFKDHQLYGCLFHFGQIIWRRVQLLKFSKDFIADYNIKFNVKMILALSFVPIGDVLIMAARLKKYLVTEDSKYVLILFKWFQQEYLSENNGNKSIKFWNAHERTLKRIPKTTNSIEGFHRHLNTLIKIKQSSFLQIGKELIKEQEITELKLLQSLHGESHCFNNDEKLQEVVSRYDEYYGVDYLKKIVLTYSWKFN